MNTFTYCEYIDNFLNYCYNNIVNTSLVKSCSFFGHREIEISEKLKNNLIKIITKLIEEENYRIFYFGGFGDFDQLCYDVVTELKSKFPLIKRVFCLTNERHLNPKNRPQWLKEEKYEDYVYFSLSFNWWYKAIYFRNLEIINASDFIIFFVRKNKEGGAKKALDYAKTKRKKHINLGI